jgi:phage replication O-like protein O
MRNALKATTPFPNALLDAVMPRLKDTEWRLLCVIVRQTLGWQEKGQSSRKESDWLTQTQLVQRTGRDRAAISRAIESLVQQRIITVRNEKGLLLQSPAARRQCRGRLYFGLHPNFLSNGNTGDLEIENSSAKSEYREPFSNSLLHTQTTKSEYRNVPKANTTKETLTKENRTKRVFQNSLGHLTTEVFCNAPNAVDQSSLQETLPLIKPKCSAAAERFVAIFGEFYEQTKKQKADIRLSSSEAARLEKLLAFQSSLDWTPTLQAFFASDASYITRRNHSLSAFLNSCQIFLMKNANWHRFGK